MAKIVSKQNFNYYSNYFNQLNKAGIDYDMVVVENYRNTLDGTVCEMTFQAKFKNIKNMAALADTWSIAPNPIKLSNISSGALEGHLSELTNCSLVTTAMSKTFPNSIKFYSEAAFKDNNRNKFYLITKPVPVLVEEGKSIRYGASNEQYNNGSVVFCASTDSPFYNYLDEGHIVVFIGSGTLGAENQRMFITNAITLDMNYIIAAAQAYPPAIDQVLKDKAFIPSKDCRLALLKMEKVIPKNLRDDYLNLKKVIETDYRSNTASVMIGKLTRNESPFIDLNNIRMTFNSANYVLGHVTIEAPNLAAVVFDKLNPNEAEWDIFTLINIYTDYINEQFKALPLNAELTGFAHAKEISFSINNIPLIVSVTTDNTRRAINGHLINVDELSPVLKRAACYPPFTDEVEGDNIKNFNKFLADVSRYSLKIRDIWSNGLPVKTMYLASDLGGGRKPATRKHPKLKFVLKPKKGFFLQVHQYDPKDKQKIVSTNEYRIGKFAEFIKKVESLNLNSAPYYSSDYKTSAEGFLIYRSGSDPSNRVAKGLNELLTVYTDGITEADKISLAPTINYELGEAEKRSEELLKEVCDLVKATKGTRAGKTGYVVAGKMRTYFVEDMEPYKTWNNVTVEGQDPYFCIVNSGDMGVGKDALIARLMALHNDSAMAKQINTLNRK